MQGSLAPIGLFLYDTYSPPDQTPNPQMLNMSGGGYALGGEVAIGAIVKYKDKYYIQARLDQNFMKGFGSDNVWAANRKLKVEAGYKLLPNLLVNLNVENNELLLHNKFRHAIDVYNLVGAGVTYVIPYRKVKRNPASPKP